MEYLAAKYLITRQQDINGSDRFKRLLRLPIREIDGSLVIVDLIHHLSLRVEQRLPSRQHLVSSIFICDTHLLLVLRSMQKKNTTLVEGNNRITHLRQSISPNRYIDLRCQSAPGLASTSVVTPTFTLDPAIALRSGYSCCRRVSCENFIELHRLVTAGPVVSAPSTFPCRLGLRLSTMQKLERYHMGKCHSIGH